MSETSSNVFPLDPDCDPRIDTLVDAIEALIRERAANTLPVASVIGSLEIVKMRFLRDLDID
jgi:hypothetical protein